MKGIVKRESEIADLTTKGTKATKPWSPSAPPKAGKLCAFAPLRETTCIAGYDLAVLGMLEKVNGRIDGFKLHALISDRCQRAIEAEAIATGKSPTAILGELLLISMPYKER